MDSERLLTKKDLCQRWQKSERCINDYISQGLIKPCKGVPGEIRFTLQYIMELEGAKLDKHSPLEFKRLEHELEEVIKERDLLRSVLYEINSKISNTISEDIKKKL
jgi:hypothetical protein